MKKWIKRISLAVALLIVVAVAVVYFSLNGIIRSEIQTQATSSLNVATTLESAALSIFGGQLSLNDLEISSPPKFTAPRIFTLGGMSVAVHYSQLTSEPIHISKIVIDNPVLVIEQANMKLNVQALMDQPAQSAAPAPAPSGQPAQPAAPSQPMKLIIDELDLNNAQVNFQPGLPGLSNEINIPIPSLSLKNIGNADGNGNGAAIKEVVMQVLTALSTKATSSGKLPIDLNKFVNDNLSSVSQSLGADFNKQLAAMNAPPALSTAINNATTQGSQSLQQDLNNLLGGKKK